MTNKELLYVQDALGHEQFMEMSSKTTSSMIRDQNLSNFISSLEQKHCDIYNKFLNLL